MLTHWNSPEKMNVGCPSRRRDRSSKVTRGFATPVAVPCRLQNGPAQRYAVPRVKQTSRSARQREVGDRRVGGIAGPRFSQASDMVSGHCGASRARFGSRPPPPKLHVGARSTHVRSCLVSSVSAPRSFPASLSPARVGPRLRKQGGTHCFDSARALLCYLSSNPPHLARPLTASQRGPPRSVAGRSRNTDPARR